MPKDWTRRILALTALTLVPVAFAACGDDDDDEVTKMTITTTDLGKKKFRTVAPKSVEGGVIEIEFRNEGKIAHEAQIVRMDGGHTVKDVLEVVAAEEFKIPDWLHAEGGVPPQEPGQTGTAKIKLPPGEYAVIDTESEDGPPPAAFGATATFTVTGKGDGEIESTDAVIAAVDKGHHKHDWKFSGLKAGTNEVTFDNRSEEIHHVIAAPIKGDATIAEVKRAMSSREGEAPIDEERAVAIPVMDGKRKMTTEIELEKGRYALLCFVNDRDGEGKSHVLEGMLEEARVE